MLKIMNKIKAAFDKWYQLTCSIAIVTDKGFCKPGKGEYRWIKAALLKCNRTEYSDVDATMFVWFSNHGKDWSCRAWGDAYIAACIFENKMYLLLGNPGTEREKKILDSLLTEQPTD